MATSDMVVSARCRHCHEVDGVTVDSGVYARWHNREGLVQEMFPKLDAGEREILMGDRNGWYVCGRCWDEVMGGDDDEG